MKYSPEIFFKTQEILKQRRLAAKTSYENRKIEIENISPEIASVSRNIAKTGIELSRLVLGGGTDFQKQFEKIKSENLNSQKLLKALLIDFGYDENYLQLKFVCEKCEDTGYVNGKICSCFTELLKKYAAEDLNKNCNISLSNFDEFELDFYPNEADNKLNISPRQKMALNFKACKDYSATFSTNSLNLFLCGKTGLGKTFLSSAIAKTVLDKGFSVTFDTTQNLLKAIENEHFGRVTNKDTMQILSDVDLLILDDLGSEFKSPFYISALYNILNTRINKNLPIIISSNFSLEHLQKNYDDRIVSRLIGSFQWLYFFGKDIRMIKSMKKS